MTRHMRFPGGKQRAVTLSYDDGVCYDVKLAEIINKKGLKCTFNINTGLFAPDEPGGQWRMSRKEAARFYVNSGHEVALHGLTHPFLERLTPGEITYEVLKDRENIEEMTGAPVRGMAYPYGTYSNTVVSVLESCGIAYSRTVESTENFDVETDWLRLKPTCHHSNPKLMSLCDEFFAERRPWDQKPLVFYLWGHSFEFNDNNNWEILERFCERAGGRNDVWYATNIEIYDYVRAYNSLSFTLNGKVCKNPSAADVYFSADGKDYCVKGGETVTLTD